MDESNIFVVIPCYKVKKHIANVIRDVKKITCVKKIICVDDKCPEESGKFIENEINSDNVIVLYNEKNLGVGGATMAGYQKALELNAHIVIKVDGDGQMDATLIPTVIKPILEKQADYTKGNRFYYPSTLQNMPTIRLLGNSMLSFITKCSSGYYHLMDPTNGYTAIHHKALSLIPLDKVAKGYFFESDLLFRLNILQAIVQDIPLEARYGDEVSNLKINKIFFVFLKSNLRNFMKRITYNYFLRDFNMGSLFLIMSVLFFMLGSTLSLINWRFTGNPNSAGTVMLSVLPFIFSCQFIIGFIIFDLLKTQTKPIQVC